MDLDVWSVSGYPSAVSSSVIACCKGESGKLMVVLWVGLARTESAHRI